MNECFIKKKHAKNPKGDTGTDKSIRGWVFRNILVIRVFADTVDKFWKIVVLAHGDVTKETEKELQ